MRWRDSAKEHNRTKREGTDNGSTTNSTDTMDDEEDWLEFVQYQKKLVAEKRERRFRAQRALREAEEKKEADEEEVKRKAIGDEAVNVWLAEQRLALLKEETERDRRNATIKEALRKELERLKVPPDRIDKAVAQAELDGSQTTTHQLLESQHIGPKQEASIPVLKVESTPKKNGSWLRSLLRCVALSSRGEDRRFADDMHRTGRRGINRQRAIRARSLETTRYRRSSIQACSTRNDPGTVSCWRRGVSASRSNLARAFPCPTPGSRSMCWNRTGPRTPSCSGSASPFSIHPTSPRSTTSSRTRITSTQNIAG